MKKIAAWILLVVYLNASAQTLLPFASDCLAHAFFWHEHLEHVHHGHVHSHHVQSELASMADDSKHHPVSHAFLFDKDALSAHLVPSILLQPNSLPRLKASLVLCWRFSHHPVWGKVFSPPPDPT